MENPAQRTINNLAQAFHQAKQSEENWQIYYWQRFNPLIKTKTLPYDVRYPYPEPPISLLPTFASWYELVEYLSLPPTVDEALFRYLALGCQKLVSIIHPHADFYYHRDLAIEAAIIVNGNRILPFFSLVYNPDKFKIWKDYLLVRDEISSLFGKYRIYDPPTDWNRIIAPDFSRPWAIKIEPFFQNSELFWSTIKYNDFPKFTKLLDIINLEEMLNGIIFLLCLYRRKEFLHLIINLRNEITYDMPDTLDFALVWYPCILEDLDLAKYIVSILTDVEPYVERIWVRRKNSVRQFTILQKQIANYMLRALKLRATDLW